MNRFFVELRLTLRRLIRLSTFQHAPKGAAGLRPLTLIFLVALSIAMVAVLHTMWAGPSSFFNEYGVVSVLAGWAIFSILVVVLGGGVSRVPLSRAMADSAAIGTAYCLVLIGTEAGSRTVKASLGVEHSLLQGAWHLINFMAFLWLLIALWRAGARLWKEPIRLPGLRFLAAVLLPAFLIPNQPMVIGPDTSWERYDIWHLARSALVSSEVTAIDGQSLASRK